MVDFGLNTLTDPITSGISNMGGVVPIGIVVGILFLMVALIFVYLRISNKTIPIADKYTLHAFILEEAMGGTYAKIDEVAVKFNPETNTTEYWFKKEKKFYPAWRFGHITGNNWITAVQTNRNEIYPAPLVMGKALVKNPHTGKFEEMDIGKLKPIVDETLLQGYVLRQKNIRERYADTKDWLLKWAPLIAVGFTTICVVMILWMAMSQLQPIVDSNAKVAQALNAVASNLGGAVNRSFPTTPVVVPTPTPPPTY